MTKKTTSAGGVVLSDEGQVLVVNQRGDSWSLPKGHVDPGENLLTTAQREIYEESGVQDLTLIKELGLFQRYRISKTGGDDYSELKTLHFFLFRTSQKELCPVDKDNPEARWVDIGDVAGMLTHPKDRAFFEGIIEIVQNGMNENDFPGDYDKLDGDIPTG